MYAIRTLIALLTFAMLALSQQQSNELRKCERLTRAKIETLLGPPNKCSNEGKNVECFGSGQHSYTVQFNEAGFAEQIIIFNACSAVDSLKKDMDRILPKGLRGKFKTKTKSAFKASCHWGNEEVYECVEIEFDEGLCLDCAPAKITITWKDSGGR